MNGRRLREGDNLTVRPGDYWLATDRNPRMRPGTWIVAVPAKRPDGGPYDSPVLGTLDPANHSVIEHEDGTITVSPSLVLTRPDGSEAYHGWLKAGVWSEA